MTASVPRGFEAAVTGLGLVTPAGIGVPDNWAAVCAGVSALAQAATLIL